MNDSSIISKLTDVNSIQIRTTNVTDTNSTPVLLRHNYLKEVARLSNKKNGYIFIPF